MFDRLYMGVLDMSKTAAMVIAVVLLGRLLLKKAPKVFSYALWAVVLFRLLCPISFETPVSIVPQLPDTSTGYNLADESIDLAGAGIAAYQAVGDLLNGGLGVQHIPTTEVTEDGMTRYVTADWWSIWILFGKYVWATGMAVMLLYSAFSYRRIKKQIEIAVPIRDNIWIADDIKSPFVIGFVRPRIYLPGNLGEKEQEYIILHEQHHIRRLDHIFKALAFLTLTIHWFNPLAWLAFGLACKDMEMSCDEAVIRKLGGKVRADYSASLLSLATGRRIIAGSLLAFGEGDTKGRIRNLAKWKKPAVWVLILAMVVCLILGVCLLTDRVNQNGQHIGITFYYGNVTEQMSDGSNPYVILACNDGTVKTFYYEAGNEDISNDLPGKNVRIRARLQDITGHLFTSEVMQVHNDSFDTLEDAIQNAVLRHHSSVRDESVLTCASFYSYASEGSTPLGSDYSDIVTEYGIVYHQNFRLENGVLVEDGGCNVPTVLTFSVTEDGHYSLAEYWEPRDGTFYPEDIRVKYPALVRPDTQKHLFEQKIAVLNQAIIGFQIDSKVVVDYLLTDICDMERWAGSLDDLMLMSELERELLVYYGQDTLDYCFAQFEKGNQTEPKGKIMASVCIEILEMKGESVGSWADEKTGQEWYDSFIRE